MTKNTRSLYDNELQASDKVEVGLDHNGKPTWYISTRDGGEEVGRDAYSSLTLHAGLFPVGSVIQLFEPIEGAKPELIEI